MSWAGWWAERAQRAEADADRLAVLVEELMTTGYPMRRREWDAARDALASWASNRDRRYGPLPAGATLEGSLKSGGVTS